MFTTGFQNKSNNIFGSSTENRFGTSSVFSFGSNSTFPGFGNVQPNNSPGQIMPCGFKTSTSDNIESISMSYICFRAMLDNFPLKLA